MFLRVKLTWVEISWFIEYALQLRQDGFSLKYDLSLGCSSYSISVSVYFSKKGDVDGCIRLARILPRRHWFLFNWISYSPPLARLLANNRREEAIEGKKWKTSRDKASFPSFVPRDGYVQSTFRNFLWGEFHALSLSMASLNRILDPLRHCCRKLPAELNSCRWLNSNYRRTTDWKKIFATKKSRAKKLNKSLEASNFYLHIKNESIESKEFDFELKYRRNFAHLLEETSSQRRFEYVSYSLRQTLKNSQKVKRNWIIFASSYLPKFHATRFAARDI